MRSHVFAFFAVVAVSLPFLSPLQARAGEIVVTSVTVRSAGSPGTLNAEVTLNDVLVISGIRVFPAGGRTILKFPEHVSRSKRVYPQVTLTARQSYEAVRTAVETKRPASGPAPALTYRIKSFTPLKKRSRLRAFALVSFNDAVDVECKVFDGRNGPWISWPSERRQDGGRWRKLVLLKDKKLRETVEEELLEAYRTVAAEEGGGAAGGIERDEHDE